MIDEENDFPSAARIVLQDFYVDDVLSGANSIEETKTLCEQLVQLLRRGGFELHKWNSNVDEIVTHVQGSRDENLTSLSINEDDSVNTLGLQWLQSSDEFQFSIGINVGAKTKREILSAISKLFDPLGFIGPIVIRAKLIMQATWTYNVEWDSPLPPELLSEWNDYVKDVQKVGIIRVPRRTVPYENSTHLYLHGFCDASERAYGACLYIQSENQEGHRTAVLLCSKSRVSPVKKITLPRLELCGAVLLTRLIQASTKALNTRFEEIRAWTDSMIVLAWIAKEPSRGQTFVSNRVSEIQSSLPYSQWGHVSGKENPADLVSRGMSCNELENSELWWAGPIWLQNGEVPKQPHDKARRSEETQELIDAEAKGYKSVSINLVNYQGIEFLNDFVERYSSISKMERLLAYCLRFIENCRKTSGERIVTNLTK